MLADCMRQSYNYYSNTFFGNILDFFFSSDTRPPYEDSNISRSPWMRHGGGGGDFIPITNLPAPAARYSPVFLTEKSYLVV